MTTNDGEASAPLLLLLLHARVCVQGRQFPPPWFSDPGQQLLLAHSCGDMIMFDPQPVAATACHFHSLLASVKASIWQLGISTQRTVIVSTASGVVEPTIRVVFSIIQLLCLVSSTCYQYSCGESETSMMHAFRFGDK
jgi:hypothetical protein